MYMYMKNTIMYLYTMQVSYFLYHEQVHKLVLYDHVYVMHTLSQIKSQSEAVNTAVEHSLDMFSCCKQ